MRCISGSHKGLPIIKLNSLIKLSGVGTQVTELVRRNNIAVEAIPAKVEEKQKTNVPDYRLFKAKTPTILSMCVLHPI